MSCDLDTFFLTLKKHKCLQIQHVNVACNFTKQVFMCLMYIVNIVHSSPYNHNVCRRWRAQEFPMWEGCYVVRTKSSQGYYCSTG